MRINIIVPNFDESSDEVVLSTWYKRVGDKISKNEIIADAETSQIACGITSTYDCILAKILVKEGEEIAQGTKIAIIETDLCAEITDIQEVVDREDFKRESAALQSNVEEAARKQEQQEKEDADALDAAKKKQKEEAATLALRKKQEEAGAALAATTKKKQEEITAQNAAQRQQEKVSAQNISQNVTEHTAITPESIDNEGSNDINVQTEDSSSSYSLTAATSAAGDKSCNKDNSYVSNIVEEDKVIEKPGEAETSVEPEKTKNLDTFTGQSETKVADIIRGAEGQAIEEGKKLRAQIIEEATKQALEESEEIKKKILREYEEKSAQDASEIHKKIIEGSITDAENMKAMLLKEAKEKAEQEAAALSNNILQTAEKLAKQKAKELEEDAMTKAKDESEKIFKKIVEKSIQEANDESRFVKKDIIHSANKHAVKKSQHIIRGSIKKAKAESEVVINAIVQDTIASTFDSIEEMKNSILKEMTLEIRSIVAESIKEIKKQVNEEIKGSVNTSVADMTFDIHREIKRDTKAAVQKLIGQLNKEIHEIIQNMLVKISYETNHKIKDSMSEVAANILYKENKTIKKEMQSMMQVMSQELNEDLRNSVHSALKQVVKHENGELKNSIHSVLKKAIQHEKKEIENDLSSLVSGLSSDIHREIKDKIENVEKIQHKQALESNTRHPLEPNCNNCPVDNSSLADRIVQEELAAVRERQFTNKLIHNRNTNINTDKSEWNRPTYYSQPAEETVPADFLKKRIYDKLKSSRQSSVISTVSSEVNMSAILSLEKAFGEQFADKYCTKLGYTPFFILGSIFALKEHHVFNAHIYENDIIYKDVYNISVVTCGANGLTAPVIQRADTLSISDIENEMITFSRKAIENTLTIEDITGGTFTVVNASMYGSLIGTDMLEPPQVATLSVHRMHNRPVSTDGGVDIKPTLYISLSYDHRIAATAEATEFLEKVKTYVENPGCICLGL